MAKHVNPEKHETNEKNYEPKHAGGQDAWDWANYTNATDKTEELPKVKKSNEKW